jgi:site-specific DNA recombinase
MTIETATRRIATYERVSSADQRERRTIETQTDALDQRLAHESNIAIVARYTDDGVSGTIPLAARPGGRRLLQDAAAGRFDELWVVTTDRLGRDAPDALLSQRRLRWLGIRLMTPAGEVDPLVGGIMSVIDDHARRALLATMARGMAHAARQGRYTGGIVAYGYRVSGFKETARLEPDPTPVAGELTAAGVVRRMFDRLAIDGWSCRRIAAELNTLGVPTRYVRDDRVISKGKRQGRTQGIWRAGRIRNMVINPLYRGELLYGRRIDGRGAHSEKRGHEIISAPCVPLVSEPLWEAAQAALTANRSIAKNTRRRYLLKSVIRCGICGLTYCGSQGRGEVGWYRCTGQLVERGPLPGRCWSQSIRTDAIEPAVWSDIEGWLRDPGDLLNELDGHAEREAQGATLEAEAIMLGAALNSLESQRTQALALNIRGRLTDVELDAQLDRIATERSELERRIAALELTEAPPAPETIDLLAEVRQRLDDGLTAEQRQEIVRLLVHIVVHTSSGGDGKRAARAVVTYRFPAVVETSTGIRASHDAR